MTANYYWTDKTVRGSKRLLFSITRMNSDTQMEMIRVDASLRDGEHDVYTACYPTYVGIHFTDTEKERGKASKSNLKNR